MQPSFGSVSITHILVFGLTSMQSARIQYVAQTCFPRSAAFQGGSRGEAADLQRGPRYACSLAHLLAPHARAVHHFAPPKIGPWYSPRLSIRTHSAVRGGPACPNSSPTFRPIQ